MGIGMVLSLGATIKPAPMPPHSSLGFTMINYKTAQI
tara:strand:+ start:1235 stop:1345 length:111 start_codon:yes stop_codon:yes gene_type:complete